MFKSHPSARWLLGLLDGRKRTPFDMIDVMNEKSAPGCQVSFKGRQRLRKMMILTTMTIPGAIDGGPAVAEQFFNDWVAEVRTGGGGKNGWRR